MSLTMKCLGLVHKCPLWPTAIFKEWGERAVFSPWTARGDLAWAWWRWSTLSGWWGEIKSEIIYIGSFLDRWSLAWHMGVSCLRSEFFNTSTSIATTRQWLLISYEKRSLIIFECHVSPHGRSFQQAATCKHDVQIHVLMKGFQVSWGAHVTTERTEVLSGSSPS